MNPEDHGLRPQDLKIIEQAVAKELPASQAPKLWLFGSRATRTHKKYSDVDLLLEASPPATRAQLSKIRESLEESSLPYKVDILRPDDVYPAFLDSIENQKIPLA